MNENKTDNFDRIFSGFNPENKHSLLPILQLIQKEYGMISVDHAVKVAKFLKVTTNKVYSVASFYDYFTFDHTSSLKIKICKGFTCHSKGSQALKEAIENRITKLNIDSLNLKKKVKLIDCSCKGHCNNSPIVQLNDSIILNANIESINNQIDEYFE